MQVNVITLGRGEGNVVVLKRKLYRYFDGHFEVFDQFRDIFTTFINSLYDQIVNETTNE